jgi:hypothetical protein
MSNLDQGARAKEVMLVGPAMSLRRNSIAVR